VAALKTWLCFSKENSGDAGSDFMMEKGEDCMVVVRETGPVKVGAAEEGCCLLSWPRGEAGWTNAWQHVLADRAAVSKANFARQRVMLWYVCRFAGLCSERVMLQDTIAESLDIEQRLTSCLSVVSVARCDLCG
jgi:hypothetical protein